MWPQRPTGNFFFGRVDLIGKGDHGKALRVFGDYLANPKKKIRENHKFIYPVISEENNAGIHV